MASKKPKKKPYKLTIQLGNDIHVGEGDSVLEALQQIPKPGKIMLKGLVTIEHDGTKGQQLFWPARMKRLFYNPTYQVVQAKMLQTVGLKSVK